MATVKRNVTHTPKNVAHVEQLSSSKPPILHPGDISPEVMREFQDCCLGYFDMKEIAANKQVRKIVPGLCDLHVKDWVTSRRDHLLGLSFAKFMTEFHAGYLDEDWEETMGRELGGMLQGQDESFWDFSIRVQAKNSLLLPMTSHLDDVRLRSCLESGMDELLAQRCQLAKISQVAEFKKWTNEVKKIDDLMWAEHCEFERIARATRENQCCDVLTENLRHVNVPNTSTQRSSSKNDRQTRCPRLTQNKQTLLMSNEGCLKCCKFFAGHRSTNCPNNFPSVANYRSLTQADVDRTRKSTRPVAALTAAGSNNHDEGSSTHPIAAVMGMSHSPTAYTAANPSAIIEGDSDSR
jgi:hypothetical protein